MGFKDIDMPGVDNLQRYNLSGYGDGDKFAGMRSKELTGLGVKLSKYGNVLVLKDGVVFTLYMQASGENLSGWKTYSEVMGLITDYTKERYPVIEVLQNDKDYFLAVFAPAAPKQILN